MLHYTCLFYDGSYMHRLFNLFCETEDKVTPFFFFYWDLVTLSLLVIGGSYNEIYHVKYEPSLCFCFVFFLHLDMQHHKQQSSTCCENKIALKRGVVLVIFYQTNCFFFSCNVTGLVYLVVILWEVYDTQNGTQQGSRHISKQNINGANVWLYSKFNPRTFCAPVCCSPLAHCFVWLTKSTQEVK